ncbi:MAG TPA: nucleotidyltransferase domain-containing protein [Solirubrobacterales bacterium]|nr:nucleotidyltransferase domain-containing protein [Solirubrobacterales bacterium]
MTELKLLANQIGANERTLRRAFNEGTLRAERPTPRKLVLGSDEKQYLRRSWKLLAALREALRTEQNVRFALLFGSAARGDDGEGSDVDLIVELRDSSLVRVVDLGLKLEGALERRVDALTVEEAEASPLLFAEALREGRVIVDREGRWAEMQPKAEQVARRARRHERARGRRALAGVDRLLARS